MAKSPTISKLNNVFTMGQAATKVKEAHTQAKSKPKQTRSVMQQKIKTAAATGVLALPDHKLKKVPAELLAMAAKLRTLDLSQNRIDELPQEINALTALKTLKVAGNALTTLPDLSGLTALTTVRPYSASGFTVTAGSF